MPIQVPQVNTESISVGNIIRNLEAIKTSRTQNALATEQLSEFKENKPARQAAAVRAGKIAELDLSTKQLELVQKTSEAITNELVSIGPEQYPAFVEKWTKAGIEPGRFPPPESITTPDQFRALQRQAVSSAKTLEAEVMESIKQKGATDTATAVEGIRQTGATERATAVAGIESDAALRKRELDIEAEQEKNKLNLEAATNKATAVEKIKQEGETIRATIKAKNITPTGELAWFVAQHGGRLPANPAEFKAYRLAIKTDTGLTDEQKSIKADYFRAISQANSAKRGEGQFVPDPNSGKVAEDQYAAAKVLKEKFIEAGGDPKSLGLSSALPAEAPQIKDGDIITNSKTKERMKWSDAENDWLVERNGAWVKK